nr:MAG TPA: hypothetical protein [Caudoviricetes sp.]
MISTTFFLRINLRKRKRRGEIRCTTYNTRICGRSLAGSR